MLVGELLVRIRAEAAQFKTTFKGIGDKLQDTKKIVEQNREELRAFGIVATAMGAGMGALALSMGLTAARTQMLGTVVKTVGTNAGYSEEELKATEDRIKSLGITTQEARLAITRFIQSELDLADAAKVARVAQDLAVISGQNSSEAFQTLTQAIVSQRPILLKQFGIVQNLNNVYDKQAEKLGKSAELLTESEKKNAFLNVILEEGAKVVGTYEMAMGDVGKQMSSFKRHIEETANAFGKYYLPIMLKAVLLSASFLQALQKLPEPIKKVMAITLLLGAGLLTLVGVMTLVILKMGFLVFSLKSFLTSALIGAKTAVILLSRVLMIMPWVALAVAISAATLALLEWKIAQIDAKNAAIESGKTRKSLIKIHEAEIKVLEDKLATVMLSKGPMSEEALALNKQILLRTKLIKLYKDEGENLKKVTAETSKETLARQELERQAMEVGILRREKTLKDYKELLEKQLKYLKTFGEATKKEQLALEKELLTITKSGVDNRATELLRIRGIRKTYLDATLSDERFNAQAKKLLLDASYRDQIISYQEYLIALGELDKIRLKEEESKWKDSGTIANAAYTAMTQEFTTAFVDEIGKDLTQLHIDFNKVFTSIRDAFFRILAEMAARALVTGLFNLITGLVTGGVSTAVSAAAGVIAPGMPGAGVVPGGAEGAIIKKPTLLVAGEKGTEVLTPLTKLDEVMQRIQPAMTPALAGAGGGGNMNITIIDRRLTGNPYDKRQMAIEIASEMKRNGVRLP